MIHIGFFFFKQKTAYEMRISDWSSDVCSSDLLATAQIDWREIRPNLTGPVDGLGQLAHLCAQLGFARPIGAGAIRDQEKDGRLHFRNLGKYRRCLLGPVKDEEGDGVIDLKRIFNKPVLILLNQSNFNITR